MNHAITVRDFLGVLLGMAGLIVAGWGFLEYMAGAMSDAPAEGDDMGKSGCMTFVIGVVLVVVAGLLSACASTPPVETKTITVDVPVAVQPITPSQIPTPPAPLGKRPPTLPQAADALFAQVCSLEAYVMRAVPLLSVSAGLPPAQAPVYPECANR